MANNNNPYASLDLRKQLYMESRSMAGYALKKGKPVPVSVIKNIEAYEDYSSTGDGKSPAPKIRKEIDIAALVDTHALLVSLVEPATPQTILMLDREQESGKMLKFLGPVSLIRQLMVATITCLFVFIALLASPFINGATLAQDVLSAEGIEQLTRLFFYVSAAGLGASFSALYIANDYISKGTFDPCHQASYWIRFSLGIIAGLLLALLVSEKSIAGDGLLSNGVIRPLLAIVGGFSADLLHSFLDRMVETFKSLFEGGAQNQLEAKAQEAKIKLAGMEIDGRMKLAQNLMQMHQQISTETDPELVKQQLNEILQNLMQSKQPA